MKQESPSFRSGRVQLENNSYPYEDIFYGYLSKGKKFLFNKFLNKEFSLIISLQNKITKELSHIDLIDKLDYEQLNVELPQFINGNLTKNKKESIIEILGFKNSHVIVHKQTKQNILNVLNDFLILYSIIFLYKLSRK